MTRQEGFSCKSCKKNRFLRFLCVQNKGGVRPLGACWCLCVCLRVFVFVGVRWCVFSFFLCLCVLVCVFRFSHLVFCKDFFVFCTYAPADWESRRVRTVHLLQLVLPSTCAVLACAHIQLRHTMQFAI